MTLDRLVSPLAYDGFEESFLYLLPRPPPILLPSKLPIPFPFPGKTFGFGHLPGSHICGQGGKKSGFSLPAGSRDCQIHPLVSLHLVQRYTFAIPVHETQRVQTAGVTLLGGATIPHECLPVVPRHTVADSVHIAECGLSPGLTLPGGQAKPVKCPVRVPWGAYPIPVHAPKPVLSQWFPLLGDKLKTLEGSPIPLVGFVTVLPYPPRTAPIHAAQHELSDSITPLGFSSGVSNVFRFLGHNVRCQRTDAGAERQGCQEGDANDSHSKPPRQKQKRNPADRGPIRQVSKDYASSRTSLFYSVDTRRRFVRMATTCSRHR